MADPVFPRGGAANPQDEGANLLFGQKIPENCMKMKEFGPRRGVTCPWCPPLDLPMSGWHIDHKLEGSYDRLPFRLQLNTSHQTHRHRQIHR